MENKLQYQNLNSHVNPSFWHKLTQLKLDVDKLDETERTIWASLAICASSHIKTSFVEVDSTSFNEKCEMQALYLPLRGKILNKNTIEHFKECDKNELMQLEARTFFKEIVIKEAVIKNPSLLNYFFILSFGDLKKYQYYYWFAFPAPQGFSFPVSDEEGIMAVFSKVQIENLLESYLKLESEQKPFFIVNMNCNVLTLNDIVAKNTQIDYEQIYFAFTDVGTSKNLYNWSLKNYITLLTGNNHFKDLCGKTINLISLRLTRCNKALSIENSKLLKVELPHTLEDSVWLGWERNERGNMGPRLACMKDTMDPKHLSETSVDLNLKLMKWRLLPGINLEKIKSLKCLLLGAGTLGCSVARCLLGWGVKSIDFVDNSTVSYSNPVRQSLFTFEDCIKVNPKAQAAAANLKKIFPGVVSNGYNLTIPMPGHPVGESLLEQVTMDCEQLIALISKADVIFLLMDSRESRWLPTLLAQYYGKTVINAALGFDTYLVMRHGVTNTKNEEFKFKNICGYEMIKGDDLGCYFCNDVTAPGNSLKERTLDQQCTVTRPGVSQIAGALAVELAVSLSQHQLGASAPAYYQKHNTHKSSTSIFDCDLENDCLLGLLPHSVRGFLSSFTQVLPATPRFKQCIACSEVVLKSFKDEGYTFLLKVFQSSRVLEDLTGLSEIYNVDSNDIWDLSDSD